MVDKGLFCEDLLYCINIIYVEIFLFCKCKEDIVLLVECFIVCFCKQYDKVFISLSLVVCEKLIVYVWYGNICELEYFIEKVVIISDGEIIFVEMF